MLLELPDPCLLAVLQFCADEQDSLFSAAWAHSRLHQAVLALPHLTAVVSQQKQLDGVYEYLDKHGQRLSSVSLGGSEELNWPVPATSAPAAQQLAA
jgi:hypothetical protein